MEHFLRCYVEQLESQPRNSLHDRRKRYDMVDYISTLIEGCREDNSSPESTVQEAILFILQYHEKNRVTNGKVCLMGKYHNILYVALKLCYLWQLKDAGTVSVLLEQIYLCEGTFERLFIGAIFGNKAPHFIAGWKSDFDNQEENLRAVVYFLDKANKSSLELTFGKDNRLYRFIDVPIENCGKASPVKLVTQLGLPDKLHIFLRYGGSVYHKNDDGNSVEYILKKLQEFNHVYPYNLINCLQLILRVTPSIKIDQDEFETTRLYIIEYYKDLVEDLILPISRCGFTPPELKHLCRCSIRSQLHENFQLPIGIKELPIPKSLHRYIDIMED